MSSMMVYLLAFSGLLLPQSVSPKTDATAMEAQYKMCSKHYIPADKCTDEIYQQLKEKDSAPVDADTAAVLDAIKELRPKLKNPDTMQIRTAYVILPKCKGCEPDDRIICLDVGGQNGFGGTSVGHVARLTYKGKSSWRDDNTFLAHSFPQNYDAWDGVCTNPKTPFHPNPVLRPGIDVTDKVKQALKNEQ